MPLDSTVTMLSPAVGAVFGVLTPRVAYRLSVPGGEPALTGCGSCGAPFASGAAGWLHVAPRCAACGVRLGPSPWWTAPVAAVAAGLTAASLAGQGWILVAGLALSVTGALLAAVDLAVQRLPDAIVWRLAVLVLVALGLAGVGAGYARAWQALLCGAAVAAGFGLLSLLTRGRIGLGDAKVAGVLSAFLGWFGWPVAVFGILLALLLNGIVAIGLLVTRRVGWHGSLPMGPSLLAGALLALAAARLLPTLTV